MTDRLIEFDQASESLTKFTPGAMQSAPNRSHRDIENRANFLVTMAVKIFQNHHGSMFGAQLIEGVFNNFVSFGSFKC